jgi:hydroxylamine reductase
LSLQHTYSQTFIIIPFTQNLFITITNANFDARAITKAIEKTLATKETLLSQLNVKSQLPDAANWAGDKDTFSTKAATKE